ncbi:MAG: uracil-DNA glycosylase [Candidatus Aminicenantes bacterium]|nr:uracil-DNA glycosylase [Candidatus Aminicenantes bacterium]
MDDAAKGLLGPAEERIRFFEEIGADFLVRPGPASSADAAGAGPRISSASGNAAELEALAAEISACRKCALADVRNRSVAGEGNPSARLMFVGEAPGADEDLRGIPFIGRAGKLLDRIIAAMGFDRQEVFIANILKCRPPNNRDPLPDEVRACSPYLLRQVEIIRPEVIVTLGKPATNFFYGRETAITVVHGRFFDFNGIQVMPTYHPAFLLRNERFKRDVWQDMRQVMAFLDKK